MSFELMRFNSARAQRSLPLEDRFVITLQRLTTPFVDQLSEEERRVLFEQVSGHAVAKALAGVNTTLLGGLARPSDAARNAARAFLASPQALAEGAPRFGDGVLFELDLWLRAAGDDVSAAQIRDWLEAKAERVGLKPNTVKALLSRIEFSLSVQALICTLFATLVLGDDPVAAPFALRSRTVRLILVAALACRAAVSDPGLDGARAVKDFLRHGRFVLPGAVLRSMRPFGGLVCRPGFSDHYVVRTEWSSYHLGEIADVRNAFAGEFSESTLERVTETESEQVDTRQSTSESEQTIGSEERYELATAIREEQSLSASANASVSSTMQYPGAEVQVNAGGGFEFSTQNSEESSSRHAKETISRAKTRVIDGKLQSRRQRELLRIRSRSLSRLENTGTEARHRTGIYRWIDRVDTATLVKYPHRYLLEFVIPEPGAWLRHALKTSRQTEPKPSPPPAWPAWLSSSEMIDPSGGQVSDYRVLAGYFKAEGIEPPPANRTIATSLVRESAGSSEGWLDGEKEMLATPPVFFTEAQRLAIPAGWEAFRWRATVTSVRRFLPQSPEDRIHGRYTLLVGDTIRSGTVGSHTCTPDVLTGDLTPCGPGEMPVVIEDMNAFGIAATVTVDCRPTADAFRAWQQRTFDALVAARRRAEADYQAALDTWAARQTTTPPALSPGRAREVMLAELKRATLTLLRQGNWLGGTALTLDPATLEPNGINFDVAARMAPQILFHEQAFEWSAMSYVLYPHYWGPSGGWEENALRDDANPDLGRFLSAGSARLVLPARPGFETEVQFFLATGIVWGGGSPPAPDDPDYLAAAREIMDLQRGPDDGVEVDSWPVRMSTAHVAIQGDVEFPMTRT
jgi:hypothetical protein